MPRESYLRPIPDSDPQAFEFKSMAGIAFGVDDPDAEADRIQYLEQLLAQNRICADGYSIDRRDSVLIGEGPFGDRHDIFYYGHCL